MGYSFCYQNTSNTVGDDVVIATALVLEDRGENFHIVQNFEVEAQPREDNCLPESQSDGMQCCVSRRLDDPFEDDLQLYGLVIPELQNGPYMIQTHGSTGRGYQFYSTQYTEPHNDNYADEVLFRYWTWRYPITSANENVSVCYW